jgi:predicted dehydrogenase
MVDRTTVKYSDADLALTVEGLEHLVGLVERGELTASSALVQRLDGAVIALKALLHQD